MHHRLIGRAGLVAVPMIVLLTACGAPRPEVRSQPAAAGGATPDTAAVAASPSPVASPVTAVDDPEECRDADCTVAVRPGDRLRLDRKTGLDAISVVALGREQVRLRFEAGGGTYRVEGMNVNVSQNCVNGRCHTRGGLTLAVGRPGTIGGIHFRLVSTALDYAVLALAPS
ncbi:MAG: hypothetical protein IRZ07_23690 [Microbispora sp.]|nr:hypothetical protein [Microbispora sp.]